MKSLTLKASAPVEKFKPTPKRKVGYTEEEVSITRAKLAEMEIDEAMETSRDELIQNTAT